ncbi:MAG: hypothetical protein R2873_20585 [Caldilineaceae bacterium]
MQVIRTIQKVEHGKIVVDMPAEFAGEDVEVIVFSVRDSGDVIIQPDAVSDVLQRFLQVDTSSFTSTQLEAYHRAFEHLRKGRRSDEPRILGLTGGLVDWAEDFNSPLGI